MCHHGDMVRWSPDAALRLEEAAIELFEEKGYAATTIPQIAERAGLTTRTFFRHFADKRDVLFLREREFPDVMGEALTGAAAGLPAIDLVRHGLFQAAVELEQWRAPIARRRDIIRAEAQLRERQLLQFDKLAESIRNALLQRGLPSRKALILSRMAVLTFELSLDEWLDGDPSRQLIEAMRETWEELHWQPGPTNG